MSYLTKKELKDVEKLRGDLHWLSRELVQNEHIVEDGLSKELIEQGKVLEEMFDIKSGGVDFD